MFPIIAVASEPASLVTLMSAVQCSCTLGEVSTPFTCRVKLLLLLSWQPYYCPGNESCMIQAMFLQVCPAPVAKLQRLPQPEVQHPRMFPHHSTVLVKCAGQALSESSRLHAFGMGFVKPTTADLRQWLPPGRQLWATMRCITADPTSKRCWQTYPADCCNRPCKVCCCCVCDHVEAIAFTPS
jgi:hypothetical protein